MTLLVTLQGPDPGQKFALDLPCAVLGRQVDSNICLQAKAVSRQHAQILHREDAYYVEDLDSSNGTFVNGKRLAPRTPVRLTERDTLQIGPYVLALRATPTVATTEPNLVIREQVNAVTLDGSFYTQAPAQKLQVVLEIAQNLARTLDLEPLLDKLLDQLLRLFPQADRGMVLLLEDDHLVVRAQRCRHEQDASAHPYSRTVVKHALENGVGILSEDIKADGRFQGSATLTSLDLHSLLCVPLISQDGRRLGVIQLDRFRPGGMFHSEDLALLTTVALQVAVVLDNASLHAELLREERFRQELVLAREIQQGFMPADFDAFPREGFELFACVHPARVVSGDLYDFTRLSDGRLAFFVGDVSGKGMPAALFMVAVRTLSRHLASSGGSPAATLKKLNDALAADNPSGMFVTLAHGLYQPKTGEIVLSSAGHPLPLLRRADGRVEEVRLRTGRLLGYEGLELNLSDAAFTLAPGELLVFYTDGVTEPRQPGGAREMFGLKRLREVVETLDGSLSLPTCADRVKAAVDRHTTARELQDDLTLFLLRRPLPGSANSPTTDLL
jgi:serine phosphatase RsbU (regulator of sigma subunit)/pSer/pThr/pTyr-binding forkhead associated (FHA) protein